MGRLASAFSTDLETLLDELGNDIRGACHTLFPGERLSDNPDLHALLCY